MLASVTVSQVNHTNSTRRYYNDWPLNEMEENIMTLATSISNHSYQQQQQEKEQSSEPSFNWRYSNNHSRSSVVRCTRCQRKFHSIGNLGNHQQLYQH
ncbi:hypothetical protein BDB01DRAFT_780018 [Pilobolus umbonatus]|nr:hypothetical protein BDB01DRAFT_780018 [Pilobolus umbonatus]